jgi:NAD(P)-dependent dehydrogenase (short-subunit alcohol dehydrogenase family)
LLGGIHIVVNNAGVSLGAIPIADVTDTQWDWIIGVNLRGVINGVAAFMPHLQDHGEEAHIVNTASIGGMQVNPGLRNGSYAATKYGVVAVTEALALETEGSAIGVSVLCPALVLTTLRKASERRPERFGGPVPSAPAPDADARLRATGAAMEPDAVGQRVVAAIRDGDFYIFTHPHTREWLEQRHARIMQGYDQLDKYRS